MELLEVPLNNDMLTMTIPQKVWLYEHNICTHLNAPVPWDSRLVWLTPETNAVYIIYKILERWYIREKTCPSLGADDLYFAQ